MRKIRAIWLALAFVCLLGFTASIAADALAQTQPVNTGLGFATGTGLSAQNPKATAVKVIRIGLGFLGIIAVGLIMYAGFLWMSAKGNEEKIEQAKKILIGAAIGFVIILAAFGIASFILGKLLQATGGGTGTGTGGEFGNGGDNPFAATGITPGNKTVNIPRNAIVRVQFNKNVLPSSVTSRTFVVLDGGKAVSGDRTVANSVIEFVPTRACEAPNQNLKCFPADKTITIELKNRGTVSQEPGDFLAVITSDEKGGILTVNSEQLSCTGSSICTFDFTTGNYVDTEAPRVNLTTAQVCVSTDNSLQASAIDNYGVSKIDFFAAGQPIGSRLNNSFPFVPSPYTATLNWNPGGATIGQTILLKATAYDLDSNSASAEKALRLSANHCCNGVKDGDETGTDCGGGCLACIGEACAAPGSEPPVCSADLCSSAFCTANKDNKADCRCQAHPRINWISPAGGFCANNADKSCTTNDECGANVQCNTGTPNGAPGNLVTISGEGFGTTPGKVYFKSANGRVAAALANDPEEGNPSCGTNVWSDTQIIAIVPAGSADGAVSVENTAGVSDSTDDAFGPLINNFKKNSINRPGLCRINPFKGRLEAEVVYNGLKLSASKAYFGSQDDPIKKIGLEPNSFTQATTGSALVPDLLPGLTTTYVLNSNVASNYLAFTKDREPYEGPTIASIDPLSGPVGQYVTIRGTGFGGTRGKSKVFFGDTSGSQADYAFPDVCASSVWTDKQIIVKVPAGIAPASYKITVARDGFPPVDSGSLLFQVTSGSPDPGLCRIDPVRGQAASSVTLWGEYFQNKDQNSSVSFNGSTTPQSGTEISSWGIDQGSLGIKPWKVIVSVPASATSGPVRVNAGSPLRSSNGVNFAVGVCTQDAECGSGAFCCASGLPEGGKCKSDSAQCYGSALTSVYEWQFSTGTTAPQCAGDQPNTCGSVCCKGPCDPANPGKCLHCPETQNECGNNECCSLSCEILPGNTQSSCPDPDSCSGYNSNQCVEAYICPNSPGRCSPQPSPTTEASCKCCCDKRLNDEVTGENPACCSGNGLTCANSCGAGGDMGVCAGCAPDGVPSTTADEKCNCVGTTGKFCAVNKDNPTGFCADCSSITDPVECSSHTQCCVDGRPGKGNKCTSVDGLQPRVPGKIQASDILNKLKNNALTAPGNGNGNETPEVQFCGFFSCKAQGGSNSCNVTPSTDGRYKFLAECITNCANQDIPCSTKNNCAEPKCDGDAHCDMASCTCKPNAQPPQDPCKNPTTQQCTITCTKGYECRTPEAVTSPTTAAAGNETPDNTCRCCCKPPTEDDPTDTCKDIDPDLSCLANQDACTGANRGACCGCTKDAQCGDPALTGCGQTGSDCCRSRPSVTTKLPEANATNVCRNPAIEAYFTQKMELASFTANVLLVGDYEGSECPTDSTPITMKVPTSRFARLVLPLKKMVARIAPVLLTKDAVADTNNYCLIGGSPIGRDVDSLTSKVSYRLTKALDQNRRYFVVVQGDPELAKLGTGTPKQYYDSKVRSLSLIGLMSNPGEPEGVPAYFTETKYPNSEIWTFKTGADICAVDSVTVSPSFHLFQRAGEANGKVLNASARGRGQDILPIAGVYDWTWSWASADSSTVSLEGENGQPAVVAIAGNKKDAQTSAQATVTITADSGTNTVGRKVQGSSQLRVFLCENPWPIYYTYRPPANYYWPWKDSTTGIEFYYCRDANGPGTSDDLPAIKDAPLTPASGRRVCMIGANKGKTCTSDTECAVVGSCWPEILKEYFFFRDTQPVTPVVSGTAAAEGGKITLNWAATQYATKYKVYYGTGRGQYSRTIDVPGGVTAMAKTIEGLANGVKYYFAVTALSDKNQETGYSNEVSLTPLDTIAPAKPAVSGTGGVGSGGPQSNGEIALYWSPVPDAISYIAYLGTRPRTGNEEYLSSRLVTTTPAANQPNTVFTSLNPGTTYYLAVRSVDIYGNKSDYSTEIEVRPNRPYLLSAVAAARGIRLRWLPFKGAEGYIINLRKNDITRTLPPISVGGTLSEYEVTGLETGEYVFSVTAKKAGNVPSESSNEQRATFGSPK